MWPERALISTLKTISVSHTNSEAKVNQLKLNVSSKIKSEYPLAEPALLPESPDLSQRVKYLYKVLAGSPYYSAERSGVSRMLEAGCQLLGMDHALLLRSLSHQVAEVMATTEQSDEEDAFYMGQHLHVEHTPTEEILSSGQTCQYQNVPGLGVYSGRFAYNGIEVNAYLGTLVTPSTVDPMVVCFFSSSPKESGFNSEDIETIELLAEGVACMIDLQKAQAQRKMTDQAMFALGSVKTLDEYLQQARLPEVYGVPARVVEVLQKRIGHAPLSIGHVAEDLNLSKRTLQRRLQQQDISFAELRDQVRFHYSIDYLIKQHLSIDSISASLDFSDRTSFTNAFKRWTGLSPSTFRKLFRDYI
jgi:AraC-type DNA-binding domain-containing proteins